MKVGVVGTGHVGLVTCATLAALGHDVVGIDSDVAKIEGLREGVTPFYEPGLEELVNEQVHAGRLSFSTDMSDTAGHEVVFICVGTPSLPNGEADVSAVESSAQEIAKHATGPTVIVQKSTVPARTADRLKEIVQEERPDLQLEVVSNPEFLRQGRAIRNSFEPDRILIGAESEWAFEVMRAIHAPLTDKGHRLIETDIPTAELSKLASNAFLALKISYANALARMCELVGADVETVTEVMASDPRIGQGFLGAGLGYGGYCLPKDVLAFERLAARLGYGFPLLQEIARINDEAVAAAAQKVRQALGDLEGKRVCLFGLAFKAGTSDVRRSPALALGQILLGCGAEVVGYDPKASEGAKAALPELKVADDPLEAATEAHCVVICTEWQGFIELDLDRLKGVMAHPLIVDGRNIYDPEDMAARGFTYLPTGRPPTGPEQGPT